MLAEAESRAAEIVRDAEARAASVREQAEARGGADPRARRGRRPRQIEAAKRALDELRRHTGGGGLRGDPEG